LAVKLRNEDNKIVPAVPSIVKSGGGGQQSGGVAKMG